MLNAIVVGNAVATAKNASLEGYKLLLCQVLTRGGQASGTPVVAIDTLGAGVGQRVVVSTDGIGAKQMMDDQTAPVRMFVQCLIDQISE